MLWPLLLCGAASLLAILRLLHTYGDRKRCAWYVQLAAVASWYLPFTIVFILPFDFSSTLYRRCEYNCDEPLGYISSDFTRRLWGLLYWSMYLTTWLVLPLMMSYVDSGAFTFKSRLRDSAWSNLRFYGISGAVGLAVGAYVALTRGFTRADLIAFFMALANFWGLFLVITFMGFGLVSIPRRLWRRGDLALELAKIESRAVAYKDKAYDSALELADVVREARQVASRVTRSDELRSCVDQILAYCPSADASTSTSRPATQSLALSSRIPAVVSEHYLAGLHNRIKRAVLKEERDRWRWNRSARRAFFLQDAIDSRANPRRQLQSNLRPWSEWGMARRSAAWWWYVAARPLAYRALAVLAATLSAAILWSELTFNLDSSHLSVVHHLLRSVGMPLFGIELTSIVIIAYMSLCAYSSVMKLRVFNIYSLESHHHTSERSLLFCGAYLCRLMFPLCYNFLNMAGSSSIARDDELTEFARFMDQIDLVPVLGEQSNRAIPVLIMVPAALAFFNVHGRVMEYLSLNRVASSARSTSDDDDDPELGPLCLPHEEGRGLLLEARCAAERQQGVSNEDTIRRYSPSGSIHSTGANFRSHASTIAPAASDSHSVASRGPREWHLGRPSLERIYDDPAGMASAAPFDSLYEPGTSGLLGDPAANLLASISNNCSSGDAMFAAGLADANNESSDSSSSNGNSRSGHNQAPTTHGAAGPLGGGAANNKPTGMAARLGRWLPARPPANSAQTKALLGRPNNATRLRPSSRQSNRFNYASDDGLHPGYSTVPRSPSSAQAPGGATYSRATAERYLYSSPFARGSASSKQQQQQQQPLLQSPSSPGRSPNPWADISDLRQQVRRHALSDSSLRVPRDAKPNNYNGNGNNSGGAGL